MKKPILLAMAAAFCALNAMAAPISPQQALQRLGVTRSAGSMRLVYTTFQTDGAAAIYAFDNEDALGYILLSADDSAAPLLGYSDRGCFKENEMSPEMRWWLGEYARQIEYARKNGIGEYINVSTRTSRKNVAPMVTTKWNQAAPYYNMTPTVGGQHCVTGCVATAMAQVMNYWKFPSIGHGEVSCNVYQQNGSSLTETMNLGDQAFDWSNMLDEYNSSATQSQKDAVAYLMKACGYSVNMTYSTTESGTGAAYVAGALVDHFGYNPNLSSYERECHSPSDWDNLIYGEIAAGRPVVYFGQSIQGGHCFVCDGYDGNGMYHFNWGWGGMSDGYFVLNALDPMSLGIGANGGGYNFMQGAVIGIQPTAGTLLPRDIYLDGSLSGNADGNKIQLIVPAIYNLSGVTTTISAGVAVEDSNGKVTYKALSQFKNYTLDYAQGVQFNGTIPVVLDNTLPNGTYKLTLVYQEKGKNQWFPMVVDQLGYNYVNVTKNGTRYSVATNKTLNISIKDASVEGELAYGQVATISVTVSNPTDRNVTRTVYPVLCDGITPVMVAQGVTMDIEAGAQVTKEFKCTFSLLSGATAPTATRTYKLRFYNPEVNSNYDNPTNLALYPGFSKEVTLVKGEDPNLVLKSIEMPGLPYQTYQSGARVYDGGDGKNVPFRLSLENSGGYFENAVEMVLYKAIDDSGYLSFDSEFPFPNTVEIAKGEQKTVDVSFDLSSKGVGEYGAFFYTSTGYLKNTQGKEAYVYFNLTSGAGVGEITITPVLTMVYDRSYGKVTVKGASEKVSVEVYSTDGKLCDKVSGVSGEDVDVDLSALPSGLYVVKAITSSGKTRILKINK